MSASDETRHRSFRRQLLLGALISGTMLAFTFHAIPQLDIATSEMLRSACGGDARHSGWCHENGVLLVPRWLAMAVCCAILGIAMLSAVRSWRGRHAQSARQWKAATFMVLAFVIGPGLLANVVLKDNWGRARPREVVALGGTQTFTPPLVPSRACASNCSFVSGEASGVFTAFFAAALVLPHVRFALISAGIAGGLTTGLVRMSTGGHFLSDVLFAGVLMTLAVLMAHALVYQPVRGWGATVSRLRPRFRSPHAASPIPHVLSTAEAYE